MGPVLPLPDEVTDDLLTETLLAIVSAIFCLPNRATSSIIASWVSGDTTFMSYDDTVYTVTIRVTNAEGGGLQSEIWATTDDDPNTKVRELRFLNTYAPPAPPASATPRLRRRQ